MAIQITEFKGVAEFAFNQVGQVPEGPPLKITDNAGAYTVGSGCRLIKIKGTGTITWAGVSGAEQFDGIEFRAVRPGAQFTVA